MNETTFLVTSFIDVEFEMYRVAKLVDGKPADTKYFKNGSELLEFFRKSE